jgi:hypothetical protein
VLAAAAVLAAAPGAAAQVLPPEPAPIVALAQNSGIHLTSPVLTNDAGTIAGPEAALSGYVAQPLGTFARFTLKRVSSLGGETALVNRVPLACAAGCGTLFARWGFGPYQVAIPLNGTRQFKIEVSVLRNGRPFASLERTFTVRRVPAPDDLNVFATGMQVVQAVQPDVVEVDRRRATSQPPLEEVPSSTGMRLIDRKPTFVRVTAAADGVGEDTLGGIDGRLEGTRDGEPLPGSPLRPLLTGTVEDVTGETDLDPARRAALRNDPAAALDFRLPASWREGTVRLRAIVNPAGTPLSLEECSGCEDRANTVRAEARFTVGQKVRLATWQFRFTHPDAEVETEDRSLDDFFRRTRDLFPIRPGFLLIEGYHGTIETGAAECTRIIGDFLWATALTGEPGLRVGVLPEDELICDAGEGRTASGVNFPGGSITTFDGGLAPPHELAHDLGIAHTSCAHGEADGSLIPFVKACDDTYPVDHGKIDGPAYDISTTTPLLPDDPPDPDNEHVHDLMSYGPGSWISRFTSHQLIDAIRVRAGPDGVAERRLAASAGGPTAPRLLVLGRVDPKGGVSFLETLAAEATEIPRAQPDGPFELRAFDSTGQVVAARRFGPYLASHGKGVAMFALALPEPDRIAAVAVFGPDGELARRTRTPNPPSLSVDDASVAGLAAGGKAVVRWQAADPDGDRLTFALQLSPDGGKTWRVVGLTSGASRQMAVDADRLPATADGRFRLLVSDGFNTRVVTSGRRLSIANHPPRAAIEADTHGLRIGAGDSLDLIGGAHDPDQPAGSVRLAWSSNRDGPFGVEPQATLVRPSIGRHTIALRAVDAAGAVDADRIVVEVVPATRVDRRAPRGVSARRAGSVIRVRFSEELVGQIDGAVRLETSRGKVLRATFRGAGAETVVVPRGKLPAGALRVRVGGRLTDLAGNRLRTQLLTVRR